MTDDEQSRRVAVRERERNLIVDASAGTGKTRLVVDRIVELIAPSEGADPIPIDRIAAITFTRKAAGELRVRTRQAILSELAKLGREDPRAAPLYRALGGIDTAHIGTIHGFADRLLRKWPARARLDPQYELDDDFHRLAHECFRWLVDGVETRRLRDVLRGSAGEGRVEEAIVTVLDAQRAGLRMSSLDTEHWTYHGLEGLVAGFLLHRDIDHPEIPAEEFDRRKFERYADEYLDLVKDLSRETRGCRWLLEAGERIRRALDEPDPVVMFNELVAFVERGPGASASDAPGRRDDFNNQQRAWDVWRIFAGDRRGELRPTPLRDDLLAPLRRWLAIRLFRLRPVVLDLYERVKAEHRAVDQIDLLLRLRNLLRDDPLVRRDCQALFDHIFVDEFQDTDPLQAEIVLFLCEKGWKAKNMDEVEVAPGTLTIVGDPKQSIYRFRRADIGIYQRVVTTIERSPHLRTTLVSSFRSAPGLVHWINSRFSEVLGRGEDGEQFRRSTGEVFYQPLAPGRTTGADPTVHLVAASLAEDAVVAEIREFEAEVTARYVRWLVERSGLEIEDPLSGRQRAVTYSDIAVLAMVTTNLRVLFDALDRDDIPYAARGGSMFLADPVQRQFLLGLCALADRDDGVAAAGLLRPPFFALGLSDLARADRDDPEDRRTQAGTIIRELRRRRFERGPGATARALLDETGFGRVLALGPNGSQRVSGVRELCLQVEAYALQEQLDFDGTMERLRTWIESPVQLDRPHPVGGTAIRIMTVHQAKGLEFPVVVLWDSCASWKERRTYDAWTVDRETGRWAMRLDHLRWEEPVGSGIEEQELRMREQERKRLCYVAATRARDVLVIPKIGDADDKRIFGKLIGTFRSPSVVEQPLHSRDAHAPWFDAAAPPVRVTPTRTTDLDEALRRDLETRALEAARPEMRPLAFTDASTPHPLWDNKGRFGSVFGDTVHVAIGLVLQRRLAPEQAVDVASRQTQLAGHRDDAIADVKRAVAALVDAGVLAGRSYRLEYPVAGTNDRGDLVAGYIDFVASLSSGFVILDFKTDAPPDSAELIPARYLEQVSGYARALRQARDSGPLRAGLLFTADGAIRWLSSGDNAGA